VHDPIPTIKIPTLADIGVVNLANFIMSHAKVKMLPHTNIQYNCVMITLYNIGHELS
jgi:hypothetical protein